MKVLHNVSLAPYTSFKCGGVAEKVCLFDSIEKLDETVVLDQKKPLWFVGFGSNTLISDRGLPGTTFLFRAGKIEQQDDTLICDAGVWWDDLVMYTINRNLWGLEFTSAIPGSVGAAVVGNIAAYGQAVADTLIWSDILDTTTGKLKRYLPEELGFAYRYSHTLQDNRHLLVVRAAFTLSSEPTKELEYDSAASIAKEKGYDLATLIGRRQTILEAREKAGSLWDYRDEYATRTAGSFFRNPMTDPETAERIMSYDETGKSLELLKKMNSVHGGSSLRVSAAHVLLAAGFTRGQSWGDVRLHPSHVLKIENAGRASAQDIYNVAHEIMSTVKDKLGVDIEPEIRFLGEF